MADAAEAALAAWDACWPDQYTLPRAVIASSLGAIAHRVPRGSSLDEASPLGPELLEHFGLTQGETPVAPAEEPGGEAPFLRQLGAACGDGQEVDFLRFWSAFEAAARLAPRAVAPEDAPPALGDRLAREVGLVRDEVLRRASTAGGMERLTAATLLEAAHAAAEESEAPEFWRSTAASLSACEEVFELDAERLTVVLLSWLREAALWHPAPEAAADPDGASELHCFLRTAMLPGPEEESDAPAGVQPSPRHDAAPDGGSPLGGEGPSASAAREAEEELAVLRAALAGRGGQGGVPAAAGDGPEAPRPRATPPAPEGCPPELLVCGAPAPDACRSPAAAGRTPDQRGLAASRGISLASSSAGSAASQPSSVTSGSRCSSPAGRAAAPMSASMVPLAGSLRWGIPVLLHIYDVSQADSIQRLNSFLANRRCPVKLGGVFHAGVEVAGMEWSFGQTEDDATPGVSPNPPREHPAHRFRQTVELPRARLSVADIQEVIAELAKEWPGSGYDLLRRNCCHFADELCQRLGVGHIPRWVHRLARLGARVDGALQLARVPRRGSPDAVEAEPLLQDGGAGGGAADEVRRAPSWASSGGRGKRVASPRRPVATPFSSRICRARSTSAARRPDERRGLLAAGAG